MGKNNVFYIKYVRMCRTMWMIPVSHYMQLKAVSPAECDHNYWITYRLPDWIQL